MTEDNSAKTLSRKKILVIVLILIAAAITAVYLIKNTGIPAFDESVYALDATEDFDLDEILSYGLPVMIDFGSDSCIPCKEMAPVLNELNGELRGKAIVKFVDVWVNTEAAGKIPLRVIPTQFFFDKDGKPYVPGEGSSFLLYQNNETGEHVFTAHEGGMSKEDILSVFRDLGVGQ